MLARPLGVQPGQFATISLAIPPGEVLKSTARRHFPVYVRIPPGTSDQYRTDLSSEFCASLTAELLNREIDWGTAMLLKAYNTLRWKRFVRGFGGWSSDLNYRFNLSARHRYLYVETPKAGCTTIKAMLQAHEGRLSARSGFDDAHRTQDLKIRGPRDDLKRFFEILASGDAYRFTFVRNPFSRVLSAYLDKICNRFPSGNWNTGPQSCERVQRERRLRRKGLGLPLHGEISFIQFLEAVLSADACDLDVHWRPLHLLTRPDLIEYDFIGRFEQFDQDLHYIAYRLGMSPIADERGRSHRTDAGEKIQQYYNARCAGIVREIYRHDFELFGYDDRLTVLHRQARLPEPAASRARRSGHAATITRPIEAAPQRVRQAS